MHLNSGFCSKSEEELVNSDSVDNISGFKSKLSSLLGNPVRTEAGECKKLCKSVSSGKNSLFSAVSEAAGPHDFCHSSSAFRATVHERFSEMGCFSEMKSLQTFTQKGACLSPMPKGSAHLARQGIPDGRNGDGSSLRSQGGHHRCVLTGLGSDIGGTTCELFGTPCSFSGPKTLPSEDNRFSCVSHIRQHNGGCLYKRLIEEYAWSMHAKTILFWSRKHLLSLRATRARPDEYLGRLVVMGESSPRGMEAPPRGSSGNMAQIWAGNSGSVCFRGEHTLSPLLLIKGNGGTTGDGCISASLARDPVICFPTGKPYSPHTVQNQITESVGLLIVPSWLGRTWIAEIVKLLYFHPWRLPHRRDLLSLGGGGEGRNFSSTSGEMESLGLARERSNLNAMGLPQNVISTIQSARAYSTRSLYGPK